MPVVGGGAVDRAAQAEGFQDRRRSEIEALQKLRGEGVFARAVGVDRDGHRSGHADGVSDLHLAPPGQALGEHAPGGVAGEVGAAAIDLGAVLAAEGPSTVAGVAAVAVDNDLAARNAAVALGPANRELARGIDMQCDAVMRPFAEAFVQQNALHVVANLFLPDARTVLG